MRVDGKARESPELAWRCHRLHMDTEDLEDSLLPPWYTSLDKPLRFEDSVYPSMGKGI